MPSKKKKEELDLKTSSKDYKIVVDKLGDSETSKYVPELKVDPKAPVPGEMPKSDLHKKKFENEPKEEDQKKLKQNKPAASVEFKIEEDSFDDVDVAEHIKSDPAKEKEEKAKKEAAESGAKLPEKKKTDEPIKNIKDMHEELIKSIRDSDSSLRIEVSKLNDDEIDE